VVVVVVVVGGGGVILTVVSLLGDPFCKAYLLTNPSLMCTTGSKLEYDTLISTMPLDIMCQIVKGQGLSHLPSQVSES